MCGLFGVYNHKKAAELTYFGLHLQQHRATDAAGIVTTDGVNLLRHAGTGIVQDVFDDHVVEGLFGRTAIGHIRYSTVEDDERKDNTQPVMENGVAIAHNGNITNTKML